MMSKRNSLPSLGLTFRRPKTQSNTPKITKSSLSTRSRPILPPLKDGEVKIQNSVQRSWLRKHGKEKYIGFDEKSYRELKKCFQSLDEDREGTIQFEELVEPLIALGIAENSEEVWTLFKSVDNDGSGKIDFTEFLEILRKPGKWSELNTLLKKMTSGKLVENADVLPFGLVVSSYRRKRLIDAIISEDVVRKTSGERVLRAYTRLCEDN